MGQYSVVHWTPRWMPTTKSGIIAGPRMHISRKINVCWSLPHDNANNICIPLICNTCTSMYMYYHYVCEAWFCVQKNPLAVCQAVSPTSYPCKVCSRITLQQDLVTWLQLTLSMDIPPTMLSKCGTSTAAWVWLQPREVRSNSVS